ncbi:MAG: hypothetical protein QQW96_13280 [Tychonema bourrellyi B0820]|nr:hypothetical protein [Tychonema bourrellyi]MDQ2098609.1 hypothetical protein [Tychonema bourrellyi B0820]
MPTPQEQFSLCGTGILPVHGEWYTAVSLTGLGDRAKIHQFSTQPQRVLNLLCKRMETKHDQNNCL